MPELLEAYTVDEARHARIHRRDVLAHLCIVGIGHARMDEARKDIDQTRRKQADDRCVIDGFL